MPGQRVVWREKGHVICMQTMREDVSAGASACTPARRWRISSSLSPLLSELHVDTQQAVLLWWQPQAIPAGGQDLLPGI